MPYISPVAASESYAELLSTRPAECDGGMFRVEVPLSGDHIANVHAVFLTG